MMIRKSDKRDIFTASSNLNNNPIYHPQFSRTFHRPRPIIRYPRLAKRRPYGNDAGEYPHLTLILSPR
jgi:hypothetical protein